MKSYRGVFLDLDGTLFKGNEVIPGAVEFVNRLEDEGIPFLYLTNNSSRTPEQVAEKLRGFGYPAEPEQVVTTALAAAAWLKEEMNSPAVYVIGEEGLIRAVEEAGCRIVDEDPEAVVVGLDRQFTYEKMKKACLAIRAGARFIGTNADRALPTEEGFLPGSGSLSMAIAASTGVSPFFIGKPEAVIMRYALKTLGTKAEETLVVGDNLDTDILAGIRGGMDTLLVLTGVSTEEDLEKTDIRPTYVVRQLADWSLQQI
ncbi:TIGR01457 family HAD-type hydrolase [Staphylospora marina]|uniref:TIGR01457 family HAD-type hydrolase n=1 Tax=Staphylospora marina TaxID=2490858 RepID=UPI000F5BD86A|nr:TIGR01457 family HAD-type hydrolase [Staphylospora marina]